MATPATGNSKLVLIGIIALIVAIAAGGATAWLVMRHGGAQAATPATAVEQAAKPVIFFKLDPFTVNLKGGAYGAHLLYVNITLQLESPSTEQYFKQHLPQVRNRLLMVLSDQDAASLVSSDGKRQLAVTLREALNKPFEDSRARLTVDDVLFTQFIVQ